MSGSLSSLKKKPREEYKCCFSLYNEGWFKGKTSYSLALNENGPVNLHISMILLKLYFLKFYLMNIQHNCLTETKTLEVPLLQLTRVLC